MKHWKKKITLLIVATFVASYTGLTIALAQSYFYFKDVSGNVKADLCYPFCSQSQEGDVSISVVSEAIFDNTGSATQDFVVGLSGSNGIDVNSVELEWQLRSNNVISDSGIVLESTGDSTRNLSITVDDLNNPGRDELVIVAKVDGNSESFVTVGITVEGCNSSNPLEGIATEQIGSKIYYLIGNRGDSDLANQQLLCLSNYQTPMVLSKDFILTADVSFGGSEEDWDWTADNKDSEGWKPLTTFTGSFDGSFEGTRHKITGLRISRESSSDQGFFGKSSGDIINMSIEGAYVRGNYRNGILVGNQTGGDINDSYTTGTVSCLRDDNGGLVGFSRADISGSYSTANITCSSGGYCGGLVGNHATGFISNCYATGRVWGHHVLGGIVGEGGNVVNSWATTELTGWNNNYVGGIAAGFSSPVIINTYAVPKAMSGKDPIGGTLGGGGTVANFGDVCEYIGDGTTSKCSEADSNKIKAYWNDDIWELLEDYPGPKLEWETDGYVDSSLEMQFPSACESGDPLSDMSQDGGAYVINDADELLCLSQMQYMDKNILSANYKLGANISFGSPSSIDWNGDSTIDSNDTGFISLGSNSLKFTGNFDGNNKTISNLYINTDKSYVGLFGSVNGSEIKNLTLSNVDIYSSSYYVGALLGNMQAGSVINVNVSGDVEGARQVGMLAGYTNGGTISNSSSSGGSVTSLGTGVGGLVGQSGSDITECYSSATVSGTDTIGGLVGKAYASEVSASYATGYVTGTSSKVGGLVGYQQSGGLIEDCYSSNTGTVSGTDDVGGLVGYAESKVATSYSTTTVSGNNNVGGLIGRVNGMLNNGYATGSVSGSDNIGGLVGSASGSVINNLSTCVYIDESVSTTVCSEDDANKIKASWDDAVWERLEDYNPHPRLEWQDPANTQTSELPEISPSACNGAGPLENLLTDGDAYVISNKDELLCLSQAQYMGGDVLSSNYKLGADITFGASEDWDGDGVVGSSSDSAGWSPLGNAIDKFTGNFDGDGHTITGLFVNRSVAYQGFIGNTTGAVDGINLSNVDVTGGNYTGGIVGYTNSSISNCSVNGSLQGGSYAGLLAGYAYGDTTNSSSSGDVSGSSSIGGLMGLSRNVALSYSSADVYGGDYVGGLAGSANGTVEQCYSSGNVSASGEGAGGLVGSLYGNLVKSYVSGNSVEGGTYVGGLAGYASYTTIENSYSSVGSVKSTGYDSWMGYSSHAGGLIGTFSGTLTNCYADSSVIASGSSSVMAGALIGSMGADWDSVTLYNSYGVGGVSSSGDSGIMYGGLFDGGGGSISINNTDDACINGGTCSVSDNAKLRASWSSSIWDSPTSSETPQLDWQ